MNENEKKWREKLTPEQYEVLRKKGTEPAFSGKFWENKETGKYICAGCGVDLFSSEHKYDSGTGWPSFYQVMNHDNVETEVDRKFFIKRTEVHCSKCDGHLGHVFDDGPTPTGKRYCINSLALDFNKENQ